MTQTISVFPPMCVDASPVGICTHAGLSMECFRAFNHNGPFTQGVEMGQILTAAILISMGSLGLYRIWSLKHIFTHHSMKLTVSLYAIFTGLLLICRRYFEIGKLLLVFAALHNMCEVSIVSQAALAGNTQRTQQLYCLAGAVVFLVIINIVALGPLQLGVLAENSGVILDGTIPAMFLAKYLQDLSLRQHGRADADLEQFHLIPAIAHSIHLIFTIVPLNMSGLWVDHTSWLTPAFTEGSIYVSAVITHTLYMVWGNMFDALRTRRSLLRRQAVGDDEPEVGIVPGQFRVANIRGFLVRGVAVAAFILYLIPYLLGTCELHPAAATDCSGSTHLYVTSRLQVRYGLGDAFLQRLQHHDFVDQGKAAPGNAQFEVVVNLNNSNAFRIMEEWTSVQAARDWHEQTGRIFHDDAVLHSLLIGDGFTHATAYRRSIPPGCPQPPHASIPAYYATVRKHFKPTAESAPAATQEAPVSPYPVCVKDALNVSDSQQRCITDVVVDDIALDAANPAGSGDIEPVTAQSGHTVTDQSPEPEQPSFSSRLFFVVLQLVSFLAILAGCLQTGLLSFDRCRRGARPAPMIDTAPTTNTTDATTDITETTEHDENEPSQDSQPIGEPELEEKYDDVKEVSGEASPVLEPSEEKYDDVKEVPGEASPVLEPFEEKYDDVKEVSGEARPVLEPFEEKYDDVKDVSGEARPVLEPFEQSLHEYLKAATRALHAGQDVDHTRALNCAQQCSKQEDAAKWNLTNIEVTCLLQWILTYEIFGNAKQSRRKTASANLNLAWRLLGGLLNQQVIKLDIFEQLGSEAQLRLLTSFNKLGGHKQKRKLLYLQAIVVINLGDKAAIEKAYNTMRQHSDRTLIEAVLCFYMAFVLGLFSQALDEWILLKDEDLDSTLYHDTVASGLADLSQVFRLQCTLEQGVQPGLLRWTEACISALQLRVNKRFGEISELAPIMKRLHLDDKQQNPAAWCLPNNGHGVRLTHSGAVVFTQSPCGTCVPLVGLNRSANELHLAGYVEDGAQIVSETLTLARSGNSSWSGSYAISVTNKVTKSTATLGCDVAEASIDQNT